ncbi:hypothetical protein, partial [Stenotrophomonas sp. GbtcB23]|uniref:hypothetical protein n=1 Tax=Stenotrophomonas sp. GbtcB23 TaxID=2824768 RepID=UPI001C303687
IPKEVAFLWPPKDQFSEADIDFLDGSAFSFNRSRLQPEERRSRPLKEQERARRHVAQPVGMIMGFWFGIDEGTALMKIPFDV